MLVSWWKRWLSWGSTSRTALFMILNHELEIYSIGPEQCCCPCIQRCEAHTMNGTMRNTSPSPSPLRILSSLSHMNEGGTEWGLDTSYHLWMWSCAYRQCLLQRLKTQSWHIKSIRTHCNTKLSQICRQPPEEKRETFSLLCDFSNTRTVAL